MSINQWRDLMPTTATFANPSGFDVFGKPTPGPVTTFKCHISRNQRQVFSPEGVTILQGGSLQMDDVYDVGEEAILTLPDGSTPKILSVKTFFDENGPHHTTVDFEG
jgi:hypothetical protein